MKTPGSNGKALTRGDFDVEVIVYFDFGPVSMVRTNPAMALPGRKPQLIGACLPRQSNFFFHFKIPDVFE